MLVLSRESGNEPRGALEGIRQWDSFLGVLTHSLPMAPAQQPLSRLDCWLGFDFELALVHEKDHQTAFSKSPGVLLTETTIVYKG